MTADSVAGRDDPGSDPSDVAELLAECSEACSAWNRPDLVAKLRLAEIRLTRPATLVCVVGEYKQGKSRLINALTGSSVCPVDDDVATSALTAVYGAAEPVARVRRLVDGESSQETVAVDELHRFATEAGDEADRAGIELIEVGIPSPALDGGLTLVDTPGAGGIVRRHTEGTLRFLSLADAIVFVTDASQELTASEMAFLKQARESCPNVLVAVTKIDLYPEWRRIVELDRRHLAATVADDAILSVSSSLQQAGRARGDPNLEQESGMGELQAAIRGRVVGRAKQANARRAVADIRWALGLLLRPIEAELEVLGAPAGSDQAIARLQAGQNRLRELQDAGSRWSTLLTDGFTDLRGEVDFQVRTAVRKVLADVDTRLEDIDPVSDWDEFVQETQESLTGAAADVLAAIDSGAASIRERIAALLSDSDEGFSDLGDDSDVDILAIWESGERELSASRGRGIVKVASSGYTALRGASSGMILLGVIGNLAGIALAGPASVGAAVVFGSKQVLDTRKTALKQRRQEARLVVRQFVDEVSLHLGNAARQQIQNRHRVLRDHFATRLQELSVAATSALQAAQESLSKDQSGREERVAQLEQWARRLRGRLEMLPAAGAGGRR